MPTTVLSNLERRAIANLSIPRNVMDLALQLRQDPHAPSIPEGETADLLGELADGGLVINLGQHVDLAKLAASLERNPTALAMPDEKARNYVDRLSFPGRAWRAEGDLWLLTEEGLAQLTAPNPEHQDTLASLRGPELAAATRKLEDVIVAEFGRVVHDAKFTGSIFDEDGGRLESDHLLANALLLEEWEAWAKQVCDAHESATGQRPRLPMAGGAGYGDATELLILAADAGGTAYGETAPTFMALTTVAVTDADTGSTITRATYTGYADKSVALADFNSPAAGAHTNVNPITFAAATAGTSTVIGFGRVTTSGGGRLIRYGTCASTVVSATNTPASFAASAYSDTLD